MPSGNHVNLAEIKLREWLAQAELKPGVRLPSERSLAAQLGLQHYAVNRAMTRLVGSGQVTRDGNKLFTAKQVEQPTNFTCHLVVAHRSIHLPGYRKAARELNIDLVVHTWTSTKEALLILGKLASADTAGVLLDPPYTAPSSTWEPAAANLLKLGIPIVSIGQPTRLVSSVLTDNVNGLEQAITHLMDLGHRELGFITTPAVSPASHQGVKAWADICQRHQLAGSAKRIHEHANIQLKDETDATARLLANDWKSVTALVVSFMDVNLQLLQERLARYRRPIPASLSIVFMGNSQAAALASPAVTSVSADSPLCQETALYLVRRLARKRNAPGHIAPPTHLRIHPQLTARKSTRALTSVSPDNVSKLSILASASPTGSTTGSSVANRSAASSGVSPGIPTASSAPAEPARTTYQLVTKAAISDRPRFAPVDLADFVNRPLNFRRGWLGDLPIRNLPPGRREIHGIPFDILGGKTRSNYGAVVFHSVTNNTGGSKKLPDTVRIPLNGKAAAVYVLHGCSYAKYLQPFARYHFACKRAPVSTVPLVTLGQVPPQHGAAETQNAGANIQDWWPDFPHQDFAHARMAPIVENTEPDDHLRHVYLYTLEWVNPTPENALDYLEIEVDPTLSTTLGVLAVTVLRP